MIEIDRLALGRGRLGDQLVGRGLVELEARLEDRMQLVALDVGERRRRWSPTCTSSAAAAQAIVVLVERLLGACRRRISSDRNS